MERKNKQEQIVARWEQLYFQERQTKTAENTAKADVLHSQMALTELARAANLYELTLS